MTDIQLKSDFFKTLQAIDWWWVKRSIEATDKRALKQLTEFDRIAFTIEQSGSNNQSCLRRKLEVLVNKITNLSKLPHSDFQIPRAAVLSEWFGDQPEDEAYLNNRYEEYSCYVSIFTEMKVYDQLRVETFCNIVFIPEQGGRKNPDFSAEHPRIGKTFVEVKSVNPPRLEEYRLMAKIIQFVEVNKDYRENILKKVKEALEDAREQFDSAKAPPNRNNRIVFLNFIRGVDAKLQIDEGGRSLQRIFDTEVFSELEGRYELQIREIETF